MASRKGAKERAASAEIVIPSVRTYRIWTPGQLRQAEASADTGNIRSAVDLCDWILADDRVRGAIDGRLSGFLNLPLTFDGSGDRRRRARAVKALEVGDDWDAMFPSPEVRQVNAWALVLGLGPGLNRWKRLEEHDDRDIPVLEFYHPQSIRYDWQRRTWLRRVNDSGVEAPFEFGDGVWVGHMPFGTYRPWSLGLWRSLARWVLLKSYAISDYGRLGESASRNVVEQDLPKDGLIDPESSKKLRAELAADLQRMARDSSIVLPAGFRYKMVEQGASTKELYSKQIELADLAIAICIRGGNLGTNVQGGSRAAAEVQERGGELSNRKDDAGAWVTTTHDQGTVYWADANFNDPGLAPWAQYATDPEEDRKKKADTMKTAFEGEAMGRTAGYKPKRKEFLQEFELDDFFDVGTEPVAPTPPTDGGTGGGGTDDNSKGADKGGKGKAPPSPAKALARLALASGDALRKGRGFVEGQLFADALTERATAEGIAALEPTVEAILEELDAATDYDDLRARLRVRYEDLDPEQLNDIVFAVLALGELAGRTATNQDA